MLLKQSKQMLHIVVLHAVDDDDDDDDDDDNEKEGENDKLCFWG